MERDQAESCDLKRPTAELSKVVGLPAESDFVRIRCLIIVPLLVTGLHAASSTAASQRPPSCSYIYSQGSFRIQGNDTPLEIYHPDAVGTFPLVFVLHGSTGALTLKAAEEPAGDNLGEKMLARNCFVVVLPHYLEAIGRKSLISQDEIATRFSVLVAVAGMLLDRAEALPWVKDQPVYIFGQSLGGYLGIALGFRRNEIAAISEVSGGLPEGYGLERVSKPRVLISHGSADTVVPASDAGVLAHYCSEHGISFNENIYTGESHYLSERARGRWPGHRFHLLGL